MCELIFWENYLNTGAQKQIEVYPLDENTINDIIEDDIPHGNYRIYRRKMQREGYSYAVIYVGRVANRTSDRGLKDRLIEHVGEWKGELFFEATKARTAFDAYKQECRDYHSWKKVGQAEYNEVHPAKIPGYTVPCPICGD